MEISDDVSNQENDRIKIRLANVSDLEFILSLVPRFTEFGPSAWCDSEQMETRTRSTIEAALRSSSSDPQLLMAEAKDDRLPGIIHLEKTSQYFTDEICGYVSELAVSKVDEGLGVGRALIRAGETWARANEYRMLIQDVFSHNDRACRFYESPGFREETRKYVKAVPDTGSSDLKVNPRIDF